MGLVGPGAVQDVPTDIKATLDGASEFEYVTILNPLSDDFAIQVAQDIPVNMPFNIGKDASGKTAQTTITERDAAQTYGLSLKNPDFQGRKHISNNTIIPAGGTINLKGNEAQVAVRQIVNELMQREGHAKLLSDPTLRAEAESRVIRKRGSIQELMDGTVQSQRAQMDEALQRSNEVQTDEPAFPGLEQATETSASGGAETPAPESSNQTSPKRLGRPPKTSQS